MNSDSSFASNEGSKRQYFYEQLGAPTLLFRNADRHDVSSTISFCDSNLTDTAINNFFESRERLCRAQGKWFSRYLSTGVDNSSSVSSSSACPEEEEEEDATSKPPKATKRRKPNSSNTTSNNYYDSPYIRAPLFIKDKLRRGMEGSAMEHSRIVDQDRLDHGDPAYLADFGVDTVVEAAAAVPTTHSIGSGTNNRQQKLVFERNHPDGPTRFGNCLVAFACRCGVCDKRTTTSSICLLYPVGALLDRVRLAYLTLPMQIEEPTEDSPTEGLYAKDTIRQIHQCGSHVFVARSDLFCTFFSVMYSENEDGQEKCQRSGQLSFLYKVDLRSLVRSSVSYRPVDVTSHPRYGRDRFTRPNVVILSETDHHERTTLHHLHCREASPLITTHSISNLQRIDEIEFTTEHPRVLWAAATSYIRPTPVCNQLFLRPRVGHGSSLYSVDLRTNLGTFQWSPSKEEFQIEGFHGISGICTDWNKPHSVWISSTSAGKTWEIDSRMPCQSLLSWAIHHACDEPGAVLPSTSFYGARTLFSQPIHAGTSTIAHPVVSVRTDPGSFGLHVLQRPKFDPLFRTQSVECVADPAVVAMEQGSVAISSTFALPDVNDGVFTCGVCSFRIPTRSILSSPDIARIGYVEDKVRDSMCIMTLTNKGDLYAHTVIESSDSCRQSQTFADLPVGASMVAVPDSHHESTSKKESFGLALSLSNKFPLPSSAIVPRDMSFEPDVSLPSNSLVDGGGTAKNDSPAAQSNELEPGDEVTGVVVSTEEQLSRSLGAFEAPAPSAVEREDFDANQQRADVSAGVIETASVPWELSDSDDCSGASYADLI